MPSNLPFALVAGLGSALLYAVALNGSLLGILLAYLAMLPLFAVGLSFGPMAVSVAAAAATVGIAVFGGLVPGLIFAISHAIPSAAITLLALHNRQWTDGQTYWYPPGRLLMGVSLWSVGLIVVAGLTLTLLGSGFAEGIRQFLGAMTEAFSQQDTPATTGPGMGSPRMGGAAAILPGIVAWSWMLMVTVNGLLGQTVVRRLGRALRPSPRLADVQIGRAWVGGFAVCGLAGLLAPGDIGFGAANVAMVLAYPLFFQGLSVAHGALNHWGAGPLVFGLFYVLLILMSWLALALVALGLAEPFVRLRTRLAGRRNP